MALKSKVVESLEPQEQRFALKDDALLNIPAGDTTLVTFQELHGVGAVREVPQYCRRNADGQAKLVWSNVPKILIEPRCALEHVPLHVMEASEIPHDRLNRSSTNCYVPCR